MRSIHRHALLLLLLALPAPVPAQEPSPSPLRMGFARNLFSDVNVGDAEAAILAWAKVVARERGISVDPSAQLFERREEIILALQQGTVDAVSVRFPDYLAIAAAVPTGPWFVTRTANGLQEEYILLVHAEAGFAAPSALKGRTLLLCNSSRMCLAQDWLDQLAFEAGQPAGAAAFFGELRIVTKVSGAVLPVFFGKADAAVATAASFATLCELNPQLGRQLRVLARSRPLVPALMVFRRDFASPEKERIVAALNDLHRTPAGQQVLTVFLSEALVQVDEGTLQETAAFVAGVDVLRARRAERAAPPAQLIRGGMNP